MTGRRARALPFDGARGSEASECCREGEIFEAVAFGRWPDYCPELTAHVASCAICADLVEVAAALHDDQTSLCRAAQPPAAGLVWWRATIRARAEAARTATKPISVLQGIAGACVAGLGAAVITTAWQSAHWLGRIGDLAVRLEGGSGDLAAASTLAAHGLPILIAIAATLVIAPLALYVTLADD